MFTLTETAYKEVKYQYKNGLFHLIISPLQIELQGLLKASPDDKSENLTETVEILRMLIRAYSETDRDTELSELLETIRRSPEWMNQLNTNPRLMYCQALWLHYSGQNDAALVLTEKIISASLDQHLNYELISALILRIKLELAKHQTHVDLLYCHRMLEKLTELLAHNKDADLNLAFFVLQAELALAEEKTGLALQKVWLAFEFTRMTACSSYFSCSILAMLGYAYLRDKQLDKASIYLNLAKKMLNPEAMVRLNRLVDGLLSQCPKSNSPNTGVLDYSHRQIVHPDGERTLLRNNILLLELMSLFLRNPLQKFSKEDLALQIWNEPYDPTRHDNLIYVNIKRVRSLFRKTKDQVEFVIRTREGYQLNPHCPYKIQENVI